jgi:hypothetical protein
VVTNTGAAPRAGAIKPLNAPAPIQVQADGTGRPVAVRLPVLATSGVASRSSRAGSPPLSPWQPVAAVDDRWKVVDEWWRGPDQQIARMYYSLVLSSGQRLTIFHDFGSAAWFRQAS